MSYTNFRPESTTSQALSNSNSNPENYGAFSASQIVAFIDNVEVGTITSMSYQVHTEKVAQYTFGNPNPRRFVTGKRGIAGAITFNMFDRSALLAVFAGSNKIGQPLLGAAVAGNSLLSVPNGGTASSSFAYGVVSPLSGLPDFASTTGLSQINSALDASYHNEFSQLLEYTDQLPPFDLTLTMTDNTGRAAYCVIGGMEIVSEAGGWSIDDMVTAQAFTFVARYMRPLTPVSPTGQPLALSTPTVQTPL